MTQRHRGMWMQCVGTVCWVLVVGAGSQVGFAQSDKPNFLILLADDLCFRDLGFAGNTDVHTPNLDRLAGEGMVLTGMYSPASTCSPTRHALYTGLYCIRAGAYPNETRAYDGVRSVFTHLLPLGYRVALQNKEHVGPPASFPYEHLGKTADDFEVSREFITRDSSQPWLLVYASNDPHSRWDRGEPGQYDPQEIHVPEYLYDNPTTREMLCDYYGEVSRLDGQVGALLDVLESSGQSERTMVMFLSEQGSSFPFGGKWTLYDNGIRSSSIVRWPGHIQPGSHSDALMQYVDVAPTLIAAAGGDPTQIDTGRPDADGYRGFDGRSFLPVLTGHTTTFRDVIFAQHTTVGLTGFLDPFPIRAVRDTRYKLIRNLAPQNRFEIRGLHDSQPYLSWVEDAARDPRAAERVQWMVRRPPVELYDVEHDPYELNNLADDPSLRETREQLTSRLDEWMRQQGDGGLATELLAKTRQSAARRARDPVRPWEKDLPIP